MIKIKKSLSILFILSLLLLTGCFQGDDDKKVDLNNKDDTNQTNKENNIEIKQDSQKKEENTINYENLRNDISINDIDLLNAGINIGKNELTNIGFDFLEGLKKSKSNLTDNINGGITKEELNKELTKIDKNLIRHFYLKLNILDSENKQNIKEGIVYVNGVNIGAFKDGLFKGDFNWLKGIEVFKIIIRSEKYGDAMINLNALNTNGKYLNANVYMKKALIKEVVLGTKQIIQLGKTKIKLNKCSIIDINGECYIKKAKLKVNFITGEEANNGTVSTNRKALTKEGKITYLQSGGMAYIDFIDNDGNILKLKKGEEILITYQITEQDIKNMEDKLIGHGEKEGYWWYDKIDGLRKESDAKYFVNKKNKTFTAKVHNLY